MLNYAEFGKRDAPSLLIVHGLFGSGRNWGVIAKRLSDAAHIVTVDMRNHGQSPRYDTNSYEDMASDLAEVISHIGAPMDVLGHSMGGKAAMVLALNRPDLVKRLVVADIAPVSYGHSQMQYIDAMRGVDLGLVSRRSEADAQLAALGVEPALCSFFTQSLDVTGQKWRLNLEVLASEMDKILAFPDINAQFDGPALFLAGALSDYVKPEHRSAIKTLFPKARFAKLSDAGHWLHADKPRAFEMAVRAFLSARPSAEA